jgi:hypothetical protein
MEKERLPADFIDGKRWIIKYGDIEIGLASLLQALTYIATSLERGKDKDALDKVIKQLHTPLQPTINNCPIKNVIPVEIKNAIRDLYRMTHGKAK